MIRIFDDPYGHEHHESGAGESSCFYDPPADITEFASSLFTNRYRLEARTARIEVSDHEGELHAHEGWTLGYVACGGGYIRTSTGKRSIGPGDRFLFGPHEPHLSVADKGRTMIEIIVFIGKAGDRQELIGIE